MENQRTFDSLLAGHARYAEEMALLDARMTGALGYVSSTRGRRRRYWWRVYWRLMGEMDALTALHRERQRALVREYETINMCTT